MSPDSRDSHDSRQILGWLAIAGTSAGLMYLLDPARGKARRARVRDKAAHGAAWLRGSLGKTARDLAQRVQGLEARAGAAFEGGTVPDPLLVERLRSKLGRIVSHPHAIDVTAEDGRVTLAGPILNAEADDLLKLVHAEPGVTAVENRLEVHEWAADVPALQGGWPRPGFRPDILQDNWAPTTRLLAGAAGTAMLVAGARARTAAGVAAGVAGAMLLGRAAANLPFRRLFGYGAGRRAVDIEKTLNVGAPVQEVFAYWANPENFPRFMHHVLAVRALGEGRYRWIVEGPGGIPVVWEAVVTAFVPDVRLTWESVPGSPIANAGQMRFEQNPDGSTRIDVRMSYNPPLGAVGHAVACLLGADPGRMMDADLARFKSLVESGKTHIRGRVVTTQELGPIVREIRKGMESIS